jgi:polysaccharide biosynthesis protein VpsM
MLSLLEIEIHDMTSAALIHRNSIVACLLLLLILTTATAFGEAPSTDTGTISGAIFGKRSKWLHGYLTLAEAYDDNIYNTEHGIQGSWVTVVSPGFQVMLPGSDQKAEDIETATTTPGGLVFGRFDDAGFRRFRAYLGYTPSFELYSADSNENTTTHSAQGGVQLNLRGGLSFDVSSRYVNAYDQNRANTSTQTDQFSSLLMNVTAGYLVTEKLRLRVDYANFAVDYRQNDNDFRDRTDNAFSAYLFFKIRPKTALFVQYRYIDMVYDVKTDQRDSTRKDYLLGVTWNITAKTLGNLRAGYGTRDYKDLNLKNSDRVTVEASFSYLFSTKTQIRIGGFHRNEESAYIGYSYTMTTGASASYNQTLTHKISFGLDLSYRRDEYKDRLIRTAGTKDAKEEFYTVAPSLTYAINRWLSTSLGYEYRENNSDFADSTFNGNVYMLRIIGAI